MTIRTITVAVALAAGVFALAPQAAHAQASEPTFQSILDGARKEGSLVVWVSSPGLPATHQALFEAFNKRFGLSLKAEWSPASSVQTGSKLIAEQGRGQGTIDIVGVGGAEEASVLVERNIIRRFPWDRVFGKELPQIGEVMNRAIPDLRGIALPVLDAVYGIAWNPDFIKDADVPASYAEVLDPKWKGKIAVNAFFFIPLDSTAFLVGKDATLEMARKLADNHPIMERGTPAVSRAIQVGQAAFGITTYHAAARSGTADKPQKFKLMADFIPVSPTYIYLPENAPHPNAARLFAAWLATEGVPIANKTELVPRVGDVGSPIEKLVSEQIARTKARIASPGSLQAVKENDEVRKAITGLIAAQK